VESVEHVWEGSMKKTISPTAFIDRCIRKNELGQDFKLMGFQREILDWAFQFDEDGKLWWNTFLWSTVKKSGKTTILGALTLYWCTVQEAPNEVELLANDLEQSLSRSFKTIGGLIQYNPTLAGEFEVQTKAVYANNGSVIRALSCDYSSEAGSNFGFVGFDELWAYVSEKSRRLWEEKTSNPTRKNSVRFVSTYAGFTNESDLLWDLYLQSVDSDEHPDGQAVRVHPTLPLYENRQSKLACYWDHTPRMPWQTSEYYAAQRRTLRPSSYTRLHENRWSSSESSFIGAETYDSCVHRQLSEDLTGPLFLGVDVGLKSDSTACVAVKFDKETDRLILAGVRIWRPTQGQVLDLGTTLEFFIRKLSRQAEIVSLYFDPSQAQRSMQILKEMYINAVEFPQTPQNLSAATQNLYDLFESRNLMLFPHADLRQHVLNSSTNETERIFRLTKEKASRKIDACAALSFACLAAIRNGKPPVLSEVGRDDDQAYVQRWDVRYPQTYGR
jgi:phage terminase large subunit-like protein